MTSPPKLFRALYVHVAGAACQQLMKQHKSLCFFLLPLLLYQGHKRCLALHSGVFAVVAQFAKTPSCSHGAFQPEDGCLRCFLAWFLDGSVNSNQASKLITVSQSSSKHWESASLHTNAKQENKSETACTACLGALCGVSELHVWWQPTGLPVPKSTCTSAL